jgi:predicted nucleotidyltransferase
MSEEMERKIKEIFAYHPEVKLAYFFGSRVSGEAGPMSDFDFAVYLDERDVKKIFEIKITLMNEIGLLLKTDKVDMVVLDTAENLELKFFIIKDGRLIFEREPYRLLVEPRIMNEYFDFHSLLLRHSLTKA